MVVYIVTAKDDDSVLYEESMIFSSHPYAHSSHLVDIMRTLDNRGQSMVSIVVVAEG